MARRQKDTGLGTFEGRTVDEVRVVLRKTGDGLSEAVKVEPRRVEIGEEGFIVLKWKAVDIHHPATRRDDPANGGVMRVQVLDAGTMTFIDEDVVQDAIERQEEKIRRWHEEQAGVQRLKGVDLAGEHILGEHADGKVDGCPKCQEETDLEANGE